MPSIEITSPVLMFAFMLFLVLFSPVFFRRIRLPGIVGLIVAGIVVGPHALGILQSTKSLQLFSTVGLIYIMFLAGLEINLNEFSRQKKNSFLLGALTFCIPMLAGTLGAKYFFPLSWPAALLLASMFASHTLIPFPITARLGINKERSVVATVGGTIITDTAAMLVLAVIAESAVTRLTAVFWARQIIFLLALVWFALWVLPRIAYTLFKIFAPDGENEFLLTLALVFLTSHFAHLAGVEAIIGAFFAGLSLSRLIADSSPLKNRLEFVGHTLFIPFFLISVGMLVNLRVMLSGWEVWGIALFMVVSVIMSKYAAAFIFAKTVRFTKDEMNVIFGLSVNQAAATLAAVIVGFRLGIFNEAILNGTIFMIFITCLIGPWFTEKYGQNVARARHLKAGEHRPEGGDRIMVAVSRDESAEFLTDVALSLRVPGSKEVIYPLYVVQDGIDIERRVSAGEKVLSGVVARIVSADVPVSPVTRIDVNIPGGILRAVKECHADTLVLGVTPSREMNFKARLFDVSDKVCDESHQLLLLCQMAHALNIGKNLFVLIPPVLECQDGFRQALESLKNLAAGNKLRLCLIGMADTVRFLEDNVLKGLSVGGEVSLHTLDQWKDLPAYIKKAGLQASDSIILMAARKGRLAWRPSMKSLAHALTMECPANNVIMVYPADAGPEDGEEESPQEDRASAHALLTRPAVPIDSKNPEKGIRQLLESQFSPGSLIFSEVMNKLSPPAPVALSPGILLFHTHSAYLTEPVILLGLGRHGKTRAFFILISPANQINAHLQALTKVARMARTLEDREFKTSETLKGPGSTRE
ncbi:MAG TPA: cation:proton antiporter [Candidatus Omnitrophota bacterium]|nr:cation:proton antiporter [Candidatus Omnitrophota bacterium]HPN55253.1 cation:proton antiporter [Candidatus Omnitrophota bacterium]